MTSRGRLLGYMANRMDRLPDALAHEAEVTALPATDDPAGYGVGFYQGGEVLHKKRPLFENSALDFAEVTRDIRTDCAVLHLRRGETVGAFRIDNTHPFRMRSWLFAHSGVIDRFDAVRARVLDQIPDFIQRNIRGQTDSEHFFHVVLSFLHDAGQLDPPEASDAQVISALRSSVSLFERVSQEVGAAPPTLNLLLSNGRRMYGLRWGQPMMVVERETDGPEEKPVRFRYVLVVGGVEAVPRGYRIVENRSVVIVDRNLKVSFQPL